MRNNNHNLGFAINPVDNSGWTQNRVTQETVALKTHSAAWVVVEITHYPTHNVLYFSRLLKLAGELWGSSINTVTTSTSTTTAVLNFSVSALLLCAIDQWRYTCRSLIVEPVVATLDGVSAQSWCILLHYFQTGCSHRPTMLPACTLLPQHN